MTETNQPDSEPVIVRRIVPARKWPAVLLAAVIFVCGGATGFGVAVMHHRPPLPGMTFLPDPPVEDLVRRLQDELLLSDDQAKQVRQIYNEREDALRKIRIGIEPNLKAQYDKLDQQMKGVLSAAQYQRWSERFNNVRDRMLPPPPRRPGGPGRGPGPGGPGFGPDGFGPGGPGGPFGPGRGPGPDGGPGRDGPRQGPPDGPPGPG